MFSGGSNAFLAPSSTRDPPAELQPQHRLSCDSGPDTKGKRTLFRYELPASKEISRVCDVWTPIFLSFVSLRWNQLGKHGRTLQVLKRTLQSLLLLPQSPPVHPHIQASPRPRCRRFQWLLLPRALRCQVAVFHVTTSHIPSHM